MERRSFLRGVFGGVAAGGLILKASPKEIEAFAAPLKPSQPLVLDPLPTAFPSFGPNMFLYNEFGERVLQVQNATIHHRRDDVTRVELSGIPLFNNLEHAYGPNGAFETIYFRNVGKK